MERITQENYGLYINGKWGPAGDGATFETRCPANGEHLATCAQATKEDVDTAVAAAWEAFKTWKNITTNERAAILNKVADIIEQNAEHLAMVESLDNGKPIRETMAIDIPYSVRHFRYFAGCIMAEEGSANILDGTTLSMILREPIGVVGQIVPWNFPFLMAAWKLAPVLAAGSRVFVQDTIYDKFVEEAARRFNLVKVGMPWEADTQMGAQINENQVKKILQYIEIGKEEGAKVACGGERATEGDLAKGCFMKPTLLVDVNNQMRVAQEEIFGPVACVIKFHDEDEVIAMANDSTYGLGGAVWTRDINRAIRVSRGIETGRMWVNTYNAIPEGAPFGGYKASGIGRETHKVILEHYTQMKNIMINLSEAPSGFYPDK